MTLPPTMAPLVIAAAACSVLIYAMADDEQHYAVVPVPVLRALAAAMASAYPETADAVAAARRDLGITDGWT